MSDMGFVLHLSLDVPSAERAGQVSRQFLRLIDCVFTEIYTAFSSISPEDSQDSRRYLFCGRRIGGNQRCLQLPDHEGDHSPTWTAR